jgi:transcriptional regulator with XRE-family HTH domain
MAMFDNLGLALSLLRELRGKSQARLSKDAGIGKSQLSKYENGKELPKLDSLEKVLNALKVGYYEFFYTMHVVDRRAAALAQSDAAGEIPEPGKSRAESLYVPPLASGSSILVEPTDQAFSQILNDLLILHRRLLEQMVFSPAKPSKRLRASR